MAVAANKNMGLGEERRQLLEEFMGRVRAIEAREGVNRAALERIKAELVALTRRKDLFSEADFPPPTEAKPNVLYLLSEDDDHRFALYLSCGMPGKNVWPHDHTTWACIAGLAGREHNRVYERTDDGRTQGRGNVREVRSLTLTDGVGIAFMPDDIHSIHALGDEPTRHFHLYGLSLERLPGRIMFNTEEGTYKVMPANTGIVDKRPLIATAA